jgi:hypothetical protein
MRDLKFDGFTAEKRISFAMVARSQIDSIKVAVSLQGHRFE